jgi:general stress protein YciG
MVEETKKPRGFATLTPERRREVASAGGKAVAAESRSFSRDKALAKSAGKKGGQNRDPDSRSFSTDAKLARSAGSRGGKASQAARKVQRKNPDG